jgi:hypothetical protein
MMVILGYGAFLDLAVRVVEVMEVVAVGMMRLLVQEQVRRASCM